MADIAGKYIGDGNPVYITFELGPTHNGVDSAKRLIKYAAEAGADAVKVQTFDPERLVSNKSQLFSYGILKNRETGEVETIEEPLYDILIRRYLTNDQWRDVKSYSDSLGLAFISTVGFEEDIKLLEDIGCHSIKIASADVNHHPLIKQAAKSGMCVQLDTGMATLGEIEEAVEVIRKEGNNNIVIHQCPSGYPARLESINLNIIPTLKRMFSCAVAYSDHTPGYEMDVAAVALGAHMVEKTITEDRMTRSTEHVMSIEPKMMGLFVKTIHDVELAMGSNRRELHEDEKIKRFAVRRSLFLRSSARKGQRIDECDIEFRRPGYGIPPNRFEELIGTTLKQDLPAGHQVKITDLDRH